MIINQFTYSSPVSFDEALTLMQDANAQLMMGDQALVTMLKHSDLTPGNIVSLAGIPGTGEVTADDKYLHIGPMVTYRELLAYLKNHSTPAALSEALGSVADPHLLNHSTIGGALYYKGNSSGSVAAVLAVLGAEMEVLNTFGTTTITVYEWILSERFSGIELGTVLKSVRVPLQTELVTAFQNHRYIKSGLNSFSAAASIKRGELQGNTLKVVLSGRGLWPTALDAAEKLIIDSDVDTEALTSAIILAIGDQLASATEMLPETEYLIHLYTIIAKRTILNLIAI